MTNTCTHIDIFFLDIQEVAQSGAERLEPAERNWLKKDEKNVGGVGALWLSTSADSKKRSRLGAACVDCRTVACVTDASATCTQTHAKHTGANDRQAQKTKRMT